MGSPMGRKDTKPRRSIFSRHNILTSYGDSLNSLKSHWHPLPIKWTYNRKVQLERNEHIIERTHLRDLIVCQCYPRPQPQDLSSLTFCTFSHRWQPWNSLLPISLLSTSFMIWSTRASLHYIGFTVVAGTMMGLWPGGFMAHTNAVSFSILQ
jgi:hypothetical protein